MSQSKEIFKGSVNNLSSYRKVLIISYAFPPINVVGAMRPFYMCRYLPYSGWMPFVVSRKVWQGSSVDSKLKLPPDNPTEVYRCRDMWDIPFLRSALVAKFMKPLFIPDEFVFWNIPVFFQTLRILRLRKIDVVVCTVPPFSSFFGALLATKMMKKAFVADFRDLWTLNEYYKKKRLNSLQRKIEENLEKLLLKSADLVILNTKTAKRQMSRKYPILVSKSVTITNGVDLDFIDSILKFSFNKFTVTYTGSFYLDRNPDFFLECLAEWINENPSIRGKIQVIFAGKNVASCDALIRKYNLREVVRLHDQISKQGVYSLQAASHVLLVFLGFQVASDYVVPAKLYEYMVFDRPVLAFVPENGEADNLINKFRLGISVKRRDKGTVKRALSQYYQDYIDGNSGKMGSHFPDEYCFPNIIRKLGRKLHQLVEKKE